MEITLGSTRKSLSLLIAILLSCCLATVALAEETDEDDFESTVGAKSEAQQEQATALAKTVQNPIASLVSLPFQYNVNTNVGEFDRVQSTLNIQPVVPFKLGDKATLVTRTIIPVTSVPIGELGSEFGFGDIQWSGFYTPKAKGSLTYGVGLQVNLPTASNEEILGAGTVSAGPTGVIFWGKGKWTLGAVASNVWDVIDAVGRTNEGDDVNFFFAQWFANYNFGKGLALGTAPIVTCDWNYETSGSDDDRCTFPLGLQISKVTFAGSQPINLLLGWYKNIAYPANGADGQVRFQINFMFPAKRER
jgi:hypothetical protein